jgi:hypothetical protein
MPLFLPCYHIHTPMSDRWPLPVPDPPPPTADLNGPAAASSPVSRFVSHLNLKATNAKITCVPGSSCTHVMTQWIPNTVPKLKTEYYNHYMTGSLIIVSSEQTTSSGSSEWNSTGFCLMACSPRTHWNSSGLSSNPGCVDAINKQVWAHLVLSKGKIS